jgi:hypothetical protein
MINKIANDMIKVLKNKKSISKPILKGFENDKKVPLRKLYVERKDLNFYLSRAYNKNNPLDENQKRLIKELKNSIDTDLHIAYEKGLIPKDWYSKFIDANTYHATNRGPFKSSKLFRKISSNNYDEGEIVEALRNKNKFEDLQNLLDIAKNQNIVKTVDGPKSTKANEIKQSTDWLKRLELQKELFDRNDATDYSLTHLKKKLKGAKSDNPLYNYKNKNKNKNNEIDIAEELRKNINPIIKKFQDITHKDKYYKGGLNGLNNPSYYGDFHGTVHKLLKPMSLHYTGGLLGGTAGNMLGGPVGGVAGGITGGAIGHLINKRHSFKIMKAMTDREFTNELIRLGRLPKEEKQPMLSNLIQNPTLKTEIIRLMFEKRDEKHN